MCFRFVNGRYYVGANAAWDVRQSYRFAMANPDPEIDYNLAIATRKDVIMATGRSDFLIRSITFLVYIFRGALDVRATKINEAMKMAAVKALALLTKESVPEVNIAYGATKLNFGRDYIIQNHLIQD
jgi:malate dehydrogenase (oxaloacetate-decarboxylating)(NADP+)